MHITRKQSKREKKWHRTCNCCGVKRFRIILSRAPASCEKYFCKGIEVLTFKTIANFWDDRLKVDHEEFFYGGSNILVDIAARVRVSTGERTHQRWWKQTATSRRYDGRVPARDSSCNVARWKNRFSDIWHHFRMTLDHLVAQLKQEALGIVWDWKWYIDHLANIWKLGNNLSE